LFENPYKLLDYCRLLALGLVIMMRAEPERKVLKLSKFTPYSFFLRLDWQREDEENFEA